MWPEDNFTTVREELTVLNLETFLDEQLFVDFFNTFLSLPCFKLKLFYNREDNVFEEFYEKLADDVEKDDIRSTSDPQQNSYFNSSIYKVSSKTAKLGYYVTQLSREQGFNFIKEHRLKFFLRSELYAEYKLSRLLAQQQLCYIQDEFIDDPFHSDSSPVSPSMWEKQGRRKSTVSFKHHSDKDYDTPIDNSKSSDEFYLPKNYSTIEEKLDAWRDSSRNSNNRLGTPSSLRTNFSALVPETLMDSRSPSEFDATESESSFSCCSQRETDRSYSRNSSVKPSSQFSLLSGVVGDNNSSDDNDDLDGGNGGGGGDGTGNNSDLDDGEGDRNDAEEDGGDGIGDHDDGNGGGDKTDLDDGGVKPSSQFSLLSGVVGDNDSSEDNDDLDDGNCGGGGDGTGNNSDLDDGEGDRNNAEEDGGNGNGDHDDGDADHDDGDGGDKIDLVDAEDDNADLNDEQRTNIQETSSGNETINNSEVVFKSNLTSAVLNEDCRDDETSDSQNDDEEMNTPSLFKTLHSRSLNATMKRRYENRYSPMEDLKEEIHDKQDILEQENVNQETKQDLKIPKISLNVTRDKKAEKENQKHDGENNEEYVSDIESNLMEMKELIDSRRQSSALSFALDSQPSIMDDVCEEETLLYDMTKKATFDIFKDFLLGTKGEKYFKFWLEAECAKHYHCDDEKALLMRDMQEKYLRCGGIFEFPLQTKRRLKLEDRSKLTLINLFNAQEIALEPLIYYWCPRFTVHQQQRRISAKYDEYENLARQRLLLCAQRRNVLSNVPQRMLHMGLHEVTPSTVQKRPHSSLAGASGCQRPQTSKPILRAKSAYPRLVKSTTPVQTNAGDLQLRLASAPVHFGCGFSEPKTPKFPSSPEPKYASSCRLFIQPVPEVNSKHQRILREFQWMSHKSPDTKALPVNLHKERRKCDLDNLIETLIHEHQMGKPLELFLIREGNQLWLNCINFWKCLQEYNTYFYADSLNPLMLARKARYMYANFVVPGSLFDLQLPVDTQDQVHKELDPPYEELFDAVEEHILFCLMDPWNQLQNEDNKFYSQIQKEQNLKHLEVTFITRRKQNAKETAEHDDDVVDRDKISIEESNLPPPTPKDGITFGALLRNRKEIEFFKAFLSKKNVKGLRDLMAWTDMETFSRIPQYMEKKRDDKATEIAKNWLNKKYFFGLDSPASKEGQQLVLNLNGGKTIKERPSTPVITESKKFVRARIERRWLLAFKNTAEFIDRQNPRNNVQDVVEDVMLKKRIQRSEAALKLLNSRWVSSSRDVVALRQTLLNEDSRREFQTYVATKSELLWNDVQFWLEVQRFKDLCHAHTQESLIKKKAQAIVECFLSSSFSQELPIDIPIEMGEKLVERLMMKNPTIHPYVFREAQTSVFRVLFNLWKEFVEFRKNIPKERDHLKYLEEHLQKFKIEVKAKREASERRRLARLSAERKRREREEREKRRGEDITSLFSLETSSVCHVNEDEEYNSWCYSKHMMEQKRQQNIALLKEKGIENIVDSASGAYTEDTKSRRSKSSKAVTQSKTSDENPTKTLVEKPTIRRPSRLKHPTGPSSYGRGSTVSFRRVSSISMAVTTLEVNSEITSTIQEEKDKVKEKEVEPKPKVIDLMSQSAKVLQKPKNKTNKQPSLAEIQVIPEETELALNVSKASRLKSPESKTFEEKINFKNLNNRPKTTPKHLSVKKNNGLKTKSTSVPLDEISCISDYSAITNINYVRKKSHSRTVRTGKTSALTSKSLKDFTNSPEGAPLPIPLPLVRITSASHFEKSKEGDSQTGLKTNIKSSLDVMSPTPYKWPRRTAIKRRMDRDKGHLIPIADVIVN